MDPWLHPMPHRARWAPVASPIPTSPTKRPSPSGRSWWRSAGREVLRCTSQGVGAVGTMVSYFLIIFSHSRRCSTSMSMIDDLSELFVDAFIYRIYTLCSFCFFLSCVCVCLFLSLSLYANCFFTFFLFIHTFIPCTTSWFLQDLHEHFLHRKPWQQDETISDTQISERKMEDQFAGQINALKVEFLIE